MVSHLTLHAYSICWPLFTCSHSLVTHDPTLHTPLNRIYPLRIALEQFILLLLKHIFSLLNALNLWLAGHRECQLSYTRLFGAGAAHHTHSKLISESMLDQYVNAAAWIPCQSCSVSTYPLEEGVHHTLTVDAQPWAICNDISLDFDWEVCSDITFPRS
jgi:hypothetical protein